MGIHKMIEFIDIGRWKEIVRVADVGTVSAIQGKRMVEACIHTSIHSLDVPLTARPIGIFERAKAVTDMRILHTVQSKRGIETAFPTVYKLSYPCTTHKISVAETFATVIAHVRDAPTVQNQGWAISNSYSLANPLTASPIGISHTSTESLVCNVWIVGAV
jgi:hypothetical protein